MNQSRRQGRDSSAGDKSPRLPRGELVTSPLLAQADALHLPLADQSIDMIFCSPPYLTARTYGDAALHSRGMEDWIAWMLDIVAECCRVCRGIVLVNCGGVTRDRCYQPGPEGLLYRWVSAGGQAWRPAYWHRVGIPGSGGKQWLRADIEYVLAFKRNREWLCWSDNTANGHLPKWGPGGEMSHRLGSGRRVNQWGPVGSKNGGGNRFKHGTASNQNRTRPSHIIVPIVKPMYRRGQSGERQNAEWTKLHTKSLPDGTNEVQCYSPPVLANPGNIVRIKVGGGLLGSKLAHENEAPFPVDLAKWFIRSCCKLGGIVLDPFSGSGTTVDAARQLGRVGIGFDLRMSQCQLGRRRLAELPKQAKRRKPKAEPLCDADSLFASIGGAA
jgi:hypothetical protein